MDSAPDRNRGDAAMPDGASLSDIQPARVYHGQMRRSAGIGEALRDVCGSLMAYRWHIVQCFKRDFVSLSHVTRFGTIWNYIMPLTPLGAYVMLMALNLFPSFGDVNGVVYVTMGVTLWFLFSGLVRTPISVVESQFASIARASTPLAPAVVSGAANLAFETLVRLVLVVVVFVIFQGAPSIRGLLAIPFLLIGAMLFLGVGLVLAMFNLAYRDIAKIVGVVLTYGIFFSGVIFPLGDRINAEFILAINPFYVFIENIRGATVGAPIAHPVSLAVYSVTAIVVALLAVRFVYRVELRLRGIVR